MNAHNKSRKDKKKMKKKLIYEVARELYQFNFENKKWAVSDEFEIDGKRYSIQKELYAWLKSEGFVSLVKLLEIK